MRLKSHDQHLPQGRIFVYWLSRGGYFPLLSAPSSLSTDTVVHTPGNHEMVLPTHFRYAASKMPFEAG